jgi:hypothetical protein
LLQYIEMQILMLEGDSYEKNVRDNHLSDKKV